MFPQIFHCTINQVVPNEHHRSQEYLGKIADWTDQKKMVLNEKTSKAMIFNFSKKYQFTTNLKLKGDKLKVLEETKLLGTVITLDLKWNKN